MSKNKGSMERSKEATDYIMEHVISNFGIDGDLGQLKLQLHPIIANATYDAEKDALQDERLRTIQYLSRVFSDEEMDIAMRGLRFKIII